MRANRIKTANLLRNRAHPLAAAPMEGAALLLLLGVALLLPGECIGQGTLTLTFEGLPRGTQQNIGVYYGSGVSIGPLGPGNVFLTGGGTPGFPDNGTGYLEIPDGNMGFWFTSGAYFDLLSFDAARYGDLSAPTLEVIGYHEMGLRVTNYFTVTSGDFQTFHPDSQFVNVYRVDVLNARWSLDNLLIGGVPEPSSGGLIILGGMCVLLRGRCRRRRS
jgi:hypothetical protein